MLNHLGATKGESDDGLVVIQSMKTPNCVIQTTGVKNACKRQGLVVLAVFAQVLE